MCKLLPERQTGCIFILLNQIKNHSYEKVTHHRRNPLRS